VSELNPRQRAAVKYIDGPLLVLAGAGSGKTRVITQKISYLVKECGIAPANIAAVTFTNKAAREMKARVASLLPGKDGRGLKVSTFHTLGLNILKREHKVLGYKPGFSIFDAQDSLALFKQLMRKEFDGGEEQAQQMQWKISRWKNDMLTPQQALACADGDAVHIAAAGMYEHYLRHMKAYNALDFDDLILLPVRLFAQFGEVRCRTDEHAALNHAANHGFQPGLARSLQRFEARAHSASLDQLHVHTMKTFGAVDNVFDQVIALVGK